MPVLYSRGPRQGLHLRDRPQLPSAREQAQQEVAEEEEEEEEEAEGLGLSSPRPN